MFGAHGMCIPTVSSLQSFEFYIRAFTRTANGKNEPFTVCLSSLFAVVRNFCICCVSKKNSHFSVRPIRGFEIRGGIRYTFCYSRLAYVNLVPNLFSITSTPSHRDSYGLGKLRVQLPDFIIQRIVTLYDSCLIQT